MTLLPFTFKKVKSGNILVINQGGEFVFLNRQQFDILINANRIKLNDEILGLFKSKQLVSTDDEDLSLNLLATKLRTRKSFLKDFTSLHMMVLTARCNCMCDYCQASSLATEKQDSDMPWEIAKKTIDLIFQSPSNYIKIEFQGGEPLLNWDVLSKCVLYAEELNKKKNKCLTFVVCTNLMQIDREKLVFCKEHNLEISTSLDGTQELHDLHRKSRSDESSYYKFIEKLNETREVMGAHAVNALLTITRDHLPKLKETIDSYVDLGFNGVFLRALNPYGYAVQNMDKLGYTVEEFVEAYKSTLSYIIDLNLSGTPFRESYATLLLQRILTPFPTGFVDLQSPSGAGISGVIYDFNGEVYPADEGRMLARMGDKRFLMGNVLKNSYNEIFNGSIIHEIVNKSCVEALPACATCAYQLYCGADPIRYYVESGSIEGKRPESGFCRKNKAIFDYLFELIEQDNEDVMNVFWAWATYRGLGEVRL